MKAGRGRRGIAPLILNLDTVWRLMINFRALALYLWERSPLPINQGQGGLLSWYRRFGEKKISCSCCDSNPIAY
jgi:hypothetical protein